MNITFTGHDIEITEALKNIIEKKFERIERHFSHPIISANVILSVQKVENAAEMIIHIKGAEITAKASADDMYKAIDLMLDKLNRQLMKHKEKMVNHQE